MPKTPPKRAGRPRKGPLDPPASLSKPSKALWRLTIEQLTAQGTWADSDLPLLERYVRSMEVARALRDGIARRALDHPDFAYTSIGSQGQLVAHPDLKSAREAERDANGYAQDLLLTSRSRRQHNIKPKTGPSRLEALLAGPPAPRAAGGAGKRRLTAM